MGRQVPVSETAAFKLDKLLGFPAKFDSDAHHPLLGHMVDVAAVAEAIWERVLGESERRLLQDAWGQDEGATCAAVAFLAGVHDLGKASPAFLSHDAAKAVQHHLPEEFRPPGGIRPQEARHGIVSALTLSRWLKEARAIPPTLADDLGAIVGGHHGVIPSAADLRDTRRRPTAVGEPPWHQLREALLHEFEGTVAVSPSPSFRRTSSTGPSAPDRRAHLRG